MSFQQNKKNQQVDEVDKTTQNSLSVEHLGAHEGAARKLWLECITHDINTPRRDSCGRSRSWVAQPCRSCCICGSVDDEQDNHTESAQQQGQESGSQGHATQCTAGQQTHSLLRETHCNIHSPQTMVSCTSNTDHRVHSFLGAVNDTEVVAVRADCHILDVGEEHNTVR